MSMKKVLLIIIDALSARHVRQAFDDGALPTMRRLAELGEMHEQCTSIFPSITPAATASIITGRYPSEHGVPGAFSYDTANDRVNYFGDDVWAILRKGFAQFFNDFVVGLNEDVLCSPTLFQAVERAGKLAASLNYMIFHGDKKHPVDVPWLLRLAPGVPWRHEVRGPDLLCLGDMVTGRARRDEDELSGPGGVFKRFGFHDEATAAFLLELVKQNGLRDLTVAYFPNNDFDSHSDGPTTALETLANVDDHLAETFGACGGIEAFLKDTAVVITGDHSQSDLIADEDARGIDLNALLEEYPTVPAGDEWTNDDQLMVCPNLRACRIYVRRGRWRDLDTIVDRMLADRRIDQVIWLTDGDGAGDADDADDKARFNFHVMTRAGKLTFRRATGEGRGRDAFGNRWDFDGSLEPVAAELDADGRLTFSDYPNALERIATSFPKPTGGDLWVTAHVGYEFKLADTKIHDCGSHGSLHELDSTSPMILAGAPDGVKLPRCLRTIDTAGLCAKIVGVDFP